MTVRRLFVRSLAFMFSSLLCLMQAQTSSSTLSALPHLIKYSGVLKHTDGRARSSSVGVVFSIYDKEDAVAAVWLETQSVTVDDTGRYTVLLGSTKIEGLPASIFSRGEARWIGVQAEGQAEQPRTLLVSVPYALKAADADTLGGKPLSAFLLADTASTSSATKSQRLSESGKAQRETTAAVDNGGNNGTVNVLTKWTSATNIGDSGVVESGGKVGIGTMAPGFTFDLANSDTTPSGANLMRIQTPSVDGARINFLSTSANGHNWAFGSNFIIGIGEFGIYDYTANKNRFLINAQGKIGFGVDIPTAQLDIANTDATSAGASLLRLRTPSVDGARINFISDSANGRNWAFGSNFIIGGGEFGIYDNTANANRFLISATGNIGIGTTTPAATLDVNGNIHTTGTIFFNDNSPQFTAGITQVIPSAGLTTTVLANKLSVGLQTCTTGQVLQSSGTTWACATPAAGSGGLTLPFSPAPVSSPSGAFTVTQSNAVVLASEPTFSSAMTTIPAAIIGVSSSTTNSAVAVAAFSTSHGPALVAWNGSTTVDPNGDSQGIVGQTDNPSGTAVEANANATSGSTVGLKAHIKSPNGIAIHASDNSGTGMAGLFDGKVQVNGALLASSITGVGNPLSISGGMNVASGGATITGSVSIQGNLSVSGSVSKNGGTFKIDHPLDPAGKYLYHSFVESPDMMNIYNGVTSLDSKGEAWITMPEWFEALNMEFRYQLTAMGRPAPNLYIAREISGNRFKISGGRVNGKVSWQVTGIRHDAWAEAHRVQVEEVKAPAEQGTYLSPELFTKNGSDKLATSDQPKK